jgi:hypothetical protein
LCCATADTCAWPAAADAAPKLPMAMLLSAPVGVTLGVTPGVFGLEFRKSIGSKLPPQS